MSPDADGVTAEVAPPPAPALTASTATTTVVPHPNGRTSPDAEDHTDDRPPSPGAEPLVAPRRRRTRRSARVPRRGRRVKRIVRRVELWSVLKLCLVFYTCVFAVTMGALVAVWGFAYSAGLVDNFEGFMNDVGWENWQFYGEDMFRRAAAVGTVLVLAGTLLTVLAAALVNVISELTGGIRIVVIEEDPTVRSSRPDDR